MTAALGHNRTPQMAISSAAVGSGKAARSQRAHAKENFYSGIPAMRNVANYSLKYSLQSLLVLFIQINRARTLLSVSSGSRSSTFRATSAASLCRPCLARHAARIRTTNFYLFNFHGLA